MILTHNVKYLERKRRIAYAVQVVLGALGAIGFFASYWGIHLAILYLEKAGVL